MRREAALDELLHAGGTPLCVHEKYFLFCFEFGEFLYIFFIDVEVVRVELGDVGGVLPRSDVPLADVFKDTVLELTATNSSEGREECGVFLAMLLGEIAHDRVCTRPCARLKAKLRTLAAISVCDWGKLKKVSDEYHLQSAKRLVPTAQCACDRLHHGKHGTVEHRYLVDDEHLYMRESAHQRLVRPHRVEVIFRECAPDANTAPRMYRHATYVRRGNTGGRSDGGVHFVLTQVANVRIHRVRLSTPWLPSEKNIRPRLHNGECRVLSHERESLAVA